MLSSIQNKLEYAVVGKTVAEIIISRADHQKEYMGLKTWKDVQRHGKIQLSNAKVAKNYMTYEELAEGTGWLTSVWMGLKLPQLENE